MSVRSLPESDLAMLRRLERSIFAAYRSERVLRAAGEAFAARLVVVDAVDDDATSFYEEHGFVPAPGHQLRLYRRMTDIRASLDRARR